MAEATNFVTREVYEADQRRIDEKFERLLEKIDSTVRDMKHYVETNVTELRNSVDTTIRNMRQDNELFKWEIKAQNSEFRENVTRDLGDMKIEIKSMNAKLNAFFTIMGLLGVAAAVLGTIQYFK